MTIDNDLSPYYHCPRCQSFMVKERENTIYCFRCELTFDKKFLKILDDEDILANEELKGVIDAFLGDSDEPRDLRLVP